MTIQASGSTNEAEREDRQRTERRGHAERLDMAEALDEPGRQRGAGQHAEK